MKLLPIAGGIMLVFVLFFAMYVRSVPSKAIPRATILPEGLENHPDILQAMRENVEEVQTEPPAESGEATATTTGGEGSIQAEETIEL
jgi:hypothetical protein